MLNIGDKVRIQHGGAFSEVTGQAVGTIIHTSTEGVDYSAGERPKGTRVHIVRFPFTVFIGDPDSINYEDELVLVEKAQLH